MMALSKCNAGAISKSNSFAANKQALRVSPLMAPPPGTRPSYYPNNDSDILSP